MVTLDTLQLMENVVFLAKVDIESVYHDVSDYRGKSDRKCGIHLLLLTINNKSPL